MSNVEYCLIIKKKYLNLILDGLKVWEIRTKPLFQEGDRIALGYGGVVLGYATVSEIKKKTVLQMKRYNNKHLANDFIEQRWRDKPYLYALVLTKVEPSSDRLTYPRSYGSVKVRLA
ncbi:MAG: ASCH domain-containing protein [Candidatus Bathyarchaeota archaeon]|nr:ASCH domain-containing protein [Candidatus Bathyarchaeota archaeon]